MTPFQLEASAKAPWTSTIVGLGCAACDEVAAQKPSASAAPAMRQAGRAGRTEWNIIDLLARARLA